MSESTTLNDNTPAAQSTPRWGIGLVIVLVMWLVIKIPEWTVPTTTFRFYAMVWGPILGTLAMMIWWLGFSRLPRPTRWAAFAAFVVGLFIAFGLGDHTMRPMGLLIFAMPLTVMPHGPDPRLFDEDRHGGLPPHGGRRGRMGGTHIG